VATLAAILAAPGTVKFGPVKRFPNENWGGVSFNMNSVAPVPLPASALVLLYALPKVGWLPPSPSGITSLVGLDLLVTMDVLDVALWRGFGGRFGDI